MVPEFQPILYFYATTDDGCGTGASRTERSLPPQYHHSVFYMPDALQSPNQQCQSTQDENEIKISSKKKLSLSLSLSLSPF